ncbi:hypothetical protein [Kutzneria kofuensis]|uniref:Kynureninase n=1 Tax=Kutzneria kofuensis TaxID=103725 RepID=A0A7W9KKK4_9PSEU|nr:hypothetical protein [Kutzneria kofuensis]MBB5894271.1 kynureninase [Kutzneria kofuensis]
MDPILTAIAGALAKEAVTVGGKAIGKLLQRVKEKFAKDPGSEVVLAQAQENPDDTKWVDALATVLHRTEENDPAFAAELRELWSAAKAEIAVTRNTVTQTAKSGGVNNNINGAVSGFVVQAGNIDRIVHHD